MLPGEGGGLLGLRGLSPRHVTHNARSKVLVSKFARHVVTFTARCNSSRGQEVGRAAVPGNNAARQACKAPRSSGRTSKTVSMSSGEQRLTRASSRATTPAASPRKQSTATPRKVGMLQGQWEAGLRRCSPSSALAAARLPPPGAGCPCLLCSPVTGRRCTTAQQPHACMLHPQLTSLPARAAGGAAAERDARPQRRHARGTRHAVCGLRHPQVGLHISRPPCCTALAGQPHARLLMPAPIHHPTPQPHPGGALAHRRRRPRGGAQ